MPSPHAVPFLSSFLLWLPCPFHCHGWCLIKNHLTSSSNTLVCAGRGPIRVLFKRLPLTPPYSYKFFYSAHYIPDDDTRPWPSAISAHLCSPPPLFPFPLLGTGVHFTQLGHQQVSQMFTGSCSCAFSQTGTSSLHLPQQRTQPFLIPLHSSFLESTPTAHAQQGLPRAQDLHLFLSLVI